MGAGVPGCSVSRRRVSAGTPPLSWLSPFSRLGRFTRLCRPVHAHEAHFEFFKSLAPVLPGMRLVTLHVMRP